MSLYKKKPNRPMADIHYLYPDIIYRFNAVLHEFWLAGNLGSADVDDQSERPDQRIGDLDSSVANGEDAIVHPAFFDKHSRSFRWITVEREAWGDPGDENSPCRHHIEGLLAELSDWRRAPGMSEQEKEERNSAWLRFLNNLPNGHFYQKARKNIQSVLDVGEDGRGRTKDVNPELLYRTLLALYSGVHHGLTTNIEGFVYQFLRNCGDICSGGFLDFIEGELSPVDEKSGVQWVKLELGAVNCGIKCRKNNHGPWLKEYVDLRDTRRLYDEAPISKREESEDELSFIFLRHLLLGVGNFEEELSKKRRCLIVPLYDTWTGGRVWEVFGEVSLFCSRAKS